MKRVVAKCSVFDISIIVPQSEALVLPPHGADIIVACPACHVRHPMHVRDMQIRDNQCAA
jgi:hypothetical protein